jgi:hypothetical protein
MMTACACSTAHVPPPAVTQAAIPARLLVHPTEAPEVPRTVDPVTGKTSITGGQATMGIALLYDYAGALKGQLDSLINAVVARDGAPPPKKKRHRLF